MPTGIITATHVKLLIVGDMIVLIFPPFDRISSVANQLINKALTFKPKLIILIVLKETDSSSFFPLHCFGCG
jgi:hypothetical protein